jgi:hypothetical protein
MIVTPGSVTRIAAPEETKNDLDGFLHANAMLQPRLQTYRAEFMAKLVALCDLTSPTTVTPQVLRVRECVRMLDNDVFRLVRRQAARRAALHHCALLAPLGPEDRLAAGAAVWVLEELGADDRQTRL